MVQLHFVSGEPSATLEHPPNTREFDPVSAHTIVSKSPLLQARINAMSKERAQQGSVINVVLPNNIAGGYPIYPPIATGPAAEPAPQVPHVLAPNTNGSLVHENHQGPRMDIEMFCTLYSLSSDFLCRFQEHGISGTHAFAHINVKDLKEMGFKIGEIIDVKEAVKMWSDSSEV